ncbi:hypothetical protein JW911_05075 [Candidatus Peregrinibacteria bacterium]|nr:hypothetical protein [Candidatus Peregrinibacteria bacterium]
MDNKIVYRCAGTCGGVSFEPGECRAEECNLHAHPLTKVIQCDACAMLTAADGKPHACEMCRKV